jgi:hypothetical protein
MKGWMAMVFWMQAASAFAADQVVVEPVHAQLTLESSPGGITLHFQAPLMALLGASDDAKKVMNKLQQPNALWVLPKSAQCSSAEPVIHSERLAQIMARQSTTDRQQENLTRIPGSLSRDTALPEVKHDELKATYVYQCVKPELLNGMQIKVMQFFPDIAHVDIQVSAAKAQSGARTFKQMRLLPSGTQLDW